MDVGNLHFLKAITRIISHQSGAIVLDGKSVSKENTKQLARKMAILPQTPESASWSDRWRTCFLWTISLSNWFWTTIRKRIMK